MEQLINITNYEDYKCALKKELLSAAEGFVRIGYLLKKARDTNILEGSGYSNVNEFAQKEFGLEKTQVSRFISINERFADTEHPDQLQDRYRGFGVAKLSIMLTIPDNINEELTPEYSKAEIQAVKEEYDEEQKVSDIERMIEPVPEHIAEVDDMLEKAIVALGEQETDLYEAVHYTANIDRSIDIEKLKDDMTPNEEAIYSIRIPGVGRVLLSLKAAGVNTITNIRSGEKNEYTWEEIATAWTIVINMDKDPRKDWEEQYGKEWPKKEEIAPVQQKKPEPKKQSKVTKAKEPAKVEEKTLHDVDESFPMPSPVEPEEEKEEVVENEQQEKQLPGQMEVEDFPQCMPEPTENTEKVTESVDNCTENKNIVTENVEKTECEDNSKRGYKAAVTNKMKKLHAMIDEKNWKGALEVAESLTWDLSALAEE